MFKLKIKILNKEAKIPEFATKGDVGLDMYSLEDKVMNPGEHHIFFVGFALEFPIGYGAFVKDKSGISKAGLHTMGGVYDAGYRGEYNVHLVNLSDKAYSITKGNKIAQLVILPVELPEIEITDELSESERGEGRFGSTGR